jgi:hypothetical protein
VAQYLRDSRAYAALLAGYTVAIIALAGIDAPQTAFETNETSISTRSWPNSATSATATAPPTSVPRKR